MNNNRSLFHTVTIDGHASGLSKVWDRIKSRAITEGRLPIAVVTPDEPWKGRLVLVHASDLDALIRDELNAAIGV